MTWDEGFVCTPMQDEDVERVAQIEAESTLFAWSPSLFRDGLRSGYSSWVLRKSDELIGHAVVLLVMDEAHLLILTIHPRWQGKKLGKRLLQQVCEITRTNGASQMFLEVRVSNLVAQKLYETQEFEQIGLRRQYYPSEGGSREDAIVMRRDL
jgi:ribosomal-protein-alanine N-acetyltransferase